MPRAGLGCGREDGCLCGGLLGGRGLWRGLWGEGDLGGCSRIGGGGGGGGVLRGGGGGGVAFWCRRWYCYEESLKQWMRLGGSATTARSAVPVLGIQPSLPY